jgi:hypothetical protein
LSKICGYLPYAAVLFFLILFRKRIMGFFHRIWFRLKHPGVEVL